DVAVRELRRGGCAHSRDLDLEVETVAGERMIAIEGHQVAGDPGDGHRARAVPGLRLQPHSHREVREALEGAPWHALHESLVILAVAIGRRDRHLQLVPGALAGQLALQTGYEVAMAVQVREWLALGGAADDLGCVIVQGVVDADDLIVRDAHTGPVQTGNARTHQAAPERAPGQTDAHGKGAKDTIAPFPCASVWPGAR